MSTGVQPPLCLVRITIVFWFHHLIVGQTAILGGPMTTTTRLPNRISMLSDLSSSSTWPSSPSSVSQSFATVERTTRNARDAIRTFSLHAFDTEFSAAALPSSAASLSVKLHNSPTVHYHQYQHDLSNRSNRNGTANRIATVLIDGDQSTKQLLLARLAKHNYTATERLKQLVFASAEQRQMSANSPNDLVTAILLSNFIGLNLGVVMSMIASTKKYRTCRRKTRDGGSKRKGGGGSGGGGSDEGDGGDGGGGGDGESGEDGGGGDDGGGDNEIPEESRHMKRSADWFEVDRQFHRSTVDEEDVRKGPIDTFDSDDRNSINYVGRRRPLMSVNGLDKKEKTHPIDPDRGHNHPHHHSHDHPSHSFHDVHPPPSHPHHHHHPPHDAATDEAAGDDNEDNDPDPIGVDEKEDGMRRFGQADENNRFDDGRQIGFEHREHTGHDNQEEGESDPNREPLTTQSSHPASSGWRSKTARRAIDPEPGIDQNRGQIEREDVETGASDDGRKKQSSNDSSVDRRLQSNVTQQNTTLDYEQGKSFGIDWPDRNGRRIERRNRRPRKNRRRRPAATNETRSWTKKRRNWSRSWTRINRPNQIRQRIKSRLYAHQKQSIRCKL